MKRKKSEKPNHFSINESILSMNEYMYVYVVKHNLTIFFNYSSLIFYMVHWGKQYFLERKRIWKHAYNKIRTHVSIKKKLYTSLLMQRIYSSYTIKISIHKFTVEYTEIKSHRHHRCRRHIPGQDEGNTRVHYAQDVLVEFSQK